MTTDEMKEKAREFGKQTQEKAGQMTGQAREQATALAGQAQEKVKKTLDEQKERGVGELSSLVQAVRQTGQQLRSQRKEGIAKYLDQTAEKMDQVVDYIDSRDVGELLEEAETLARRRPEVFLGGALVLGMVAGRFMKSSRDRRMKDSVSRWDEPASTTSTGQTPFPAQTSSPTPTAY